MNAYIRRDPDPGKYRRPWFIEVSQIIDNPGARAASSSPPAGGGVAAGRGGGSAAHVESPPKKKPPTP